jgi:GNAT superfamily N-acetyltransferase
MISRKPHRPKAETLEGTPSVEIRAMTAEDEEKLRVMFSRLFGKSIYHRFHMPYPEVPGWMVAHLSKAGRPGEAFLVAVAEDEIVAHAMYVEEGSGEAEMAVVVEDRWQSKGVGKLLLFRLALEARRKGIEAFTATVLGENRRMIGLFDSVFREVEYGIKGGAYHVRVPLCALKPVSKLEVLDAPDEQAGDVASHRVMERVA